MLNAESAVALTIPTRRGRGTHQSLWFDPVTRLRMKTIRQNSEAILGVRASNSVFVRVALKLLEDKLTKAMANDDPSSPAALWLVNELRIAGEAGGNGE